MQLVARVNDLRAALAPFCKAQKTIGLVPTMGFLHAGHEALIATSIACCDVTVVSLFVNPTQFGPNEDLARYPRSLDADRQLCQETGVDILFTPSPQEVYPPGFSTFVEPGAIALPLCGAFRPGHFRGVATVVAKLFNMVGADHAFFGMKDYQQVAVVRRMVADLDMPIKIVGVPTVRERDGMALSSRNAYLSATERSRACSLSKGLFAAQDAFAQGERKAKTLRALALAQFDVDQMQYLELRDADQLTPVDEILVRPAVLAVAAYLGQTRLIDNIVLERDDVM